MPRTVRVLPQDIKSALSISYRKSTDGSKIVVTNLYEEHNGRPLLLSKETLSDMLALLERTPLQWVTVLPA
jgi:hypothetical protein